MFFNHGTFFYHNLSKKLIKNGELTAVEFIELLEMKKNTFYTIMQECEEVR